MHVCDNMTKVKTSYGMAFVLVLGFIPLLVLLFYTYTDNFKFRSKSGLHRMLRKELDEDSSSNMLYTRDPINPTEKVQNGQEDTFGKTLQTGPEVQEKIKTKKQIKLPPYIKRKHNNKDSLKTDVGKHNRTRYLIYLCDDHKWCGGWGDRQRGIVGAYVMSIVTNRKFGIDMSYPCDIKLFYVPNKIDWFIKVNDIKGLSWEVVDWMKQGSVDCESDFNKLHPSDVVYLKSNKDVISRIIKSPRYGSLVPDEYRDKRTAWGIGWHKLMKPSIHMEEHVAMFMNKIPDEGDLICAHIRMRRSSNLPNDAPPLTTLSEVESLWKFLSKYEKNASRIFIATDSLEVRSSARKWFGDKELDTNGIVLHIDRQGKQADACLGFEMALLEQIVLTKCKVLVRSGSGFSIRAALMSLIKQKVFTFRDGKIT